jgi:hypothetical protein
VQVTSLASPSGDVYHDTMGWTYQLEAYESH